MKKVQTKNHRQKSIGNGSRTVKNNDRPRVKKRSIASAVKRVVSKSQSSRPGQRSGCSGCSRSSGKTK